MFRYKKLIVSLFILAIIVGGLFYADRTFAAGEITINNFDLNPKIIANNTGSTQFQMTFRVTINLNKFNSRCGSNESSFYWYVYKNVAGLDLKRMSGEQSFDRTTSTINVSFDQPITIDTTEIPSGGTAKYYGQVNCPAFLSTYIDRSNIVSVTFGSAFPEDKAYACIAADNKYACSSANLNNCSDVSACAGRPCIQIAKNVCGQDAGTGEPLSIATSSLPDGGIGQSYNQVIQASGGTPFPSATPYSWSQSGSLPVGLSFNTVAGSISGTPTIEGKSTFTIRATDNSSPSQSAEKQFSITVTKTGPGPGGGTCNNNRTCDAGEVSATCRDCPVAPGQGVPILFKLDNPLQADNLLELIDVLATWLFNLSIPIVVVMIVYAGVMFLTSRGEPARVTKARQILLYAVVGFAIILIGKGFITLIESILNLGTSP